MEGKMARFKMELTLSGLKNILIPDMFPSYEDGDPEKYNISLVQTTPDNPLIVLESIDDNDTES
jgi:hypothetical protein